ncbi:DUF2793 domain-containing protein [Sphingomonas arenae]|uniref:DUF2793 domain-containing protein n=1 Tax=Sphingomonas arenae TaxID=2812555 RepID=UPI001968956F|nr:DUF2793 domain-containing protein [Sphingomonas arenae]
MDETNRLALPFILPGQAQKELFHNEALQILDTIVQPVVKGGPANDPPSDPALGATYIVGPSPTGAWADHPGAVAAWSDGGWRFVEPFEGMEVSTSSGLKMRYASGQWDTGQVLASAVLIGGQKVVGSRAPAIPDPTAGTTVDQQARGSIVQILNALRLHGLISAT